MQDAPSPAIWHSEMNKDRTAKEDAPGIGRMVRYLTGVGEFDTNDPHDPWFVKDAP